MDERLRTLATGFVHSWYRDARIARFAQHNVGGGKAADSVQVYRQRWPLSRLDEYDGDLADVVIRLDE